MKGAGGAYIGPLAMCAMYHAGVPAQRVARSSGFSNSAVLHIRRAAEFLRRETVRYLLGVSTPYYVDMALANAFFAAPTFFFAWSSSASARPRL